MLYHLDCACGAKSAVRETAAGAKEVCHCGRTVVVPSLRDLRRLSGLPEPNLSPDMVAETLLLAGNLPQEDHCVLCGAATNDFICCTTECERAQVERSQPSAWQYALCFLTFGLIGVAVITRASARNHREWGKDRIFPLPLRVCAACQPQLTDPEDLKAALMRVPMDRRLLEKYPVARITLAAH
jgi:predicted nucleic acid-binding Zn ribbon protein